MRVVFAGTPEFAAIQLKALLDAHINVVGVYTQPDKPAGRGQHLHPSPVKELALLHKLPVLQPATLKTEDGSAILGNFEPDLMVVAAYGLLLPKAILQTPRFGCINVHASLLPRWRGASPIQQAILAGDKETGVTLMQMDEGLDTGDMLAKASYFIKQDETTASLHDALALIGAKLLADNLKEFTLSHQWPQKQPQNPALATHAGKIKKEQGKIDWHQEAKIIDRLIRAFNPWPVAYTTLNNEIIRIWQASLVENSSTAPPGTIIEHEAKGILVATSCGTLLITQAQLPGKKRMPFSELLKGHHDLFALGNRLGI